jgi:hypothetical protein
VKFLLGVVSKICALHGRPPFRIAAGMYLARDRRFVCLELELRAFAAELEQRFPHAPNPVIRVWKASGF